MSTVAAVDAYIAAQPPELRERLEALRRTIREAAPEAEERISYGMPSYHEDGRALIHFGAYKRHIGVYPVPRGDPVWRDELGRYGGGRGTLQLPHDEPLPLDLIVRLVERARGQAAGRGGKPRS